jgi:ECF sigma factor
MESTSRNLTELLLAWGQGDANALDELTPLVYGHLHRLARHYIAGERPGHTLQATALVNEAYLRVVGLQPSRVAEPGSVLRRGGSIDAPDSGLAG